VPCDARGKITYPGAGERCRGVRSEATLGRPPLRDVGTRTQQAFDATAHEDRISGFNPRSGAIPS
jgi:hypothetical protein